MSADTIQGTSMCNHWRSLTVHWVHSLILILILIFVFYETVVSKLGTAPPTCTLLRDNLAGLTNRKIVGTTVLYRTCGRGFCLGIAVSGGWASRSPLRPSITIHLRLDVMSCLYRCVNIQSICEGTLLPVSIKPSLSYGRHPYFLPTAIVT